MSYIPPSMKGSIIDRTLAVHKDAINNGFGAVADGIAAGVHGAYTNAFDTSMYKVVSAKPLSEIGMSPLNLNSGVSTSRGFHAVQ